MTRHSAQIIAVLFAMPLLFSPARADWPEFRGPTGQGHAGAVGLPVRWSATENTTWKRPIPGSGWSSPVLHGGRIYLTTAVTEPSSNGDSTADAASAESDRSLRMLALDEATGRTLWNVEVFHQAAASPRIHQKNSHASPTPLLKDGRLYVHFGHQGTACLDLDGGIRWKRRLDYKPVHGNGGSPILVDGKLVFSVDGANQTMIVAWDAATGRDASRADRRSEAVKKFSFSTPLAIEVEGRTQIISPGSDTVLAIDPRSGEEIWRVRYDGYSVIPRPVFGQGLVFVCTGYNTPSLLAIDPGGQGDVTDTHVRWVHRKGVPHTPSLLLIERELYMVSDRGIASCLDAVSGDVHWQERVGGKFSASPIFAGGRIYLQSEEGEGLVIRAGRTFEQLARNPLDERTLASYAVGESALFIRSADHLYRVEK